MAACVKGENDLAEYDPCCCRSDITTTIITNAHEISMERGRLWVVLATIVINILAVSLLTFAPWSDWRAGAALNIVDNCLLVGFALVRQDALLGRFLLFGLLVGFTELSADAWLVDYTRTLDYSIGGGPMIWRSPLWMPLAWERLWQCNSDISDCDCRNVWARSACL